MVSAAAGATPGAKMDMRCGAVRAEGQAGQPQNGRTRLHLARQIPITHILRTDLQRDPNYCGRKEGRRKKDEARMEANK